MVYTFMPFRFMVLIFRGWVDLRAHGFVGRNHGKNPVTPPGIDPGTARLVAQRLNHYATPGPYICVYIYIYIYIYIYTLRCTEDVKLYIFTTLNITIVYTLSPSVGVTLGCTPNTAPHHGSLILLAIRREKWTSYYERFKISRVDWEVLGCPRAWVGDHLVTLSAVYYKHRHSQTQRLMCYC